MEIKDFVLQTIKEIEGALKEASNDLVKYELDVASSKGVHFNLAVTNTETSGEEKKKGIGAKIKVLDASIGKENTKQLSSESVSRIEFNIKNRAEEGGPVEPEDFS